MNGRAISCYDDENDDYKHNNIHLHHNHCMISEISVRDIDAGTHTLRIAQPSVWLLPSLVWFSKCRVPDWNHTTKEALTTACEHRSFVCSSLRMLWTKHRREEMNSKRRLNSHMSWSSRLPCFCSSHAHTRPLKEGIEQEIMHIFARILVYRQIWW